MVRSSGQVASGSLRVKTTVSSPFALMLFMLASSEEAPFGSAMSTLRSNEKTTSSAVRSEPSENFRPELSVHSKIVLSWSVNSQLFAASGTALLPPGSTVRRFWYIE